MRWLCVIGLLSTVFLVTGCGTDETPSVGDGQAENKAAETAATVPPDDAATLTALEKLGAKLKRGGDGRVTAVTLRGVELPADDLAPLTSLTNLQSVLLNDTAVTDGGLLPIGAVTTLRNLDLRGCGISNDGLAHLVGLTSLRALRLSGKSNATQVDDQGMGHIGKLAGRRALLLDFLRQHSIVPDVVFYTTLMHVCAVAMGGADLDSAHSILYMLEQEGLEHPFQAECELTEDFYEWASQFFDSNSEEWKQFQEKYGQGEEPADEKGEATAPLDAPSPSPPPP